MSTAIVRETERTGANMFGWIELVLVALGAAALTGVAAIFLTSLLTRENRQEHRIESDYGVEDEQFDRSLVHLLPPGFTEGNRITTLVNGAQIFRAMMDAVRSAQNSITFETFIYWGGDIGAQFADAFIERARAGVKVHMLLDWFGSKKMDREQIKKLREGGVEVEVYHKPQLFSGWRFNHRSHRKVLVVDGRIGFTGGVGIADEWTGDGKTPEHWRDNEYMIEGPAVAQLQGVFMDNWLRAHDRVLHGPNYFPKLDPTGSQRAQVFDSGPAEGNKSMRILFLFAFACARREVRMSIAYFIPDNLTVKAMVSAAKRGVRVQLIVPGDQIDIRIVRHASRSRWRELMEGGVELYEYQPTMYHCKVMIVDGRWVSVGSSNFDPRSFRHNDEVTLNVLDADFAAEQVRLHEADRARSRRVRMEDLDELPTSEKLKDWSATLVCGQL